MIFERAYLKEVIRPVKDKVAYITKIHESDNEYRIIIYFKKEDEGFELYSPDILLAPFKCDLPLYLKMKVGIWYELKELGL